MGRIQVAALVLAATAAVAIPAEPAGAAGLTIANHRAIYDMTMASSSERSGITSVEGRMVLEFAGTRCEGYTLNSRIITQFSNRDGKVTLTDIRSTQWESGDGESFRFGTRQYLENALQEETEGRASRGAGGAPGMGVMTKPSEETFELPADAIFPTEHNLRLMQAAADGQTSDRTVVFDATDGKKYFIARTFIGKEIPPGEADLPAGVANVEVLKPLRSWPVTISYFDDTDKTAQDQLPSHEVSFVMFENGVSTALQLNYGDFAVKGVLKGLEIFETPKCE